MPEFSLFTTAPYWIYHLTNHSGSSTVPTGLMVVEGRVVAEDT